MRIAVAAVLVIGILQATKAVDLAGFFTAAIESITADQFLTLVRPQVLAGVQAIESTGGRIDVFDPKADMIGVPLLIGG